MSSSEGRCSTELIRKTLIDPKEKEHDPKEKEHVSKFPLVAEDNQNAALHGKYMGETEETAEAEKPRCTGPLKVVVDQPLLSILLTFIPLGIVSYVLQWSDTATFCLNFLAIIPQAWLIGKATENLAVHLGERNVEDFGA